MKDYMILINEESKPVLVEVPDKPKHSYGASRSWEELDYKSKIDRVISDNSKHIPISRVYGHLPFITGDMAGWYKNNVGQTFPLPTGYKVSFEYQMQDWNNRKLAILYKLEEEKVVAPSEEVKQCWISVKDRLPENDTRVLGYSPKYGVATAWFVNGEFPRDLSTTHWMHLPKPPVLE